MKLVVTGLSNEQDFETGESNYVLVLNREIRIPVSEEVAALVIEKMYGGQARESPPIQEEDQEQEEEVEIQKGWAVPPPTSEYQDEDGVDQV